jgi:hypothetical protein
LATELVIKEEALVLPALASRLFFRALDGSVGINDEHCAATSVSADRDAICSTGVNNKHAVATSVTADRDAITYGGGCTNRNWPM